MGSAKSFIAQNRPAGSSTNFELEFSSLLAHPLIPGASLEPIAAEMIPQPFAQLLVHHRHMTPTLSAFYRDPVQLRVITSSLTDNWLTRRIALVLGESEEIVEHAIVRIDLSTLGPMTIASIKHGRQPLGNVLREHGVVTRVLPELFVQVDRIDAAERPWFGRIGSIECDDKPSIQMFEVLTGFGSIDAGSS